MNLDTLTAILITVAPSLSAIITNVTAEISNKIKTNNIINKIIAESKQQIELAQEEASKANAKLLKAYNDMAILKTKIASIEKLLLEQKEKEGEK